MGDLKGKRVIVTAGAQGIGKAISEHLILAGCDVAVHYLTSSAGAAELSELASRNDVKFVSIQGDLTDEQAADEFVAESVRRLGGLNILVNNAGSLVERRFLEDLDRQYWRHVLDLNLSSMMYVTRDAVKHLGEARGSSIVNIASLAGRKGGHPGSLAYATAKGAVITWTRALSTELAPRGIRVNVVAPGFIEGTSFHRVHTTAESARETIGSIPLGRSGTPADVARAVAFLCSEFDGFITGATLDVNGGVYSA